MDWDNPKITKERLQECLEYFQHEATGEQLAFWVAPGIWAMGGPKKGIFFYKGQRSFKKKSRRLAFIEPGDINKQYQETEASLKDYMEGIEDHDSA